MGKVVAHTFLLHNSCTGTRQTTSSEECEMTQQERGLFKTPLGAMEGRNKKSFISGHVTSSIRDDEANISWFML